jgi:predicted nicotinamide N-methyase
MRDAAKKGEARDERLVAELERRFVTINDDVCVGEHTVNLIRPRSAEDLISETDFERDERLPYWAELWPSSTVLAHFILEAKLPAVRAIELGCGVGLVSIAGTLAGHQMLATDYYDEALLFARANAFRNLGREIEVKALDWREIPAELPRFELVLASDVLYESRYAELVARTIDRVLAPGGCAYVADPGRIAAGAFVEACEGLGLRIGTKATRPYLAGKVRQTISVYEVRGRMA